MRQYLPKTHKTLGGDIHVKVGLSNHATKTDLKSAIGINTSKWTLKSNLVSLKAELDKLDIDRLITVPDDLSKLIDVVKSDVFKKTMYHQLNAKINSIGTGGFVLKSKYDTGKSDLEKKIRNADKENTWYQ